jgi:hypothetical protein
MVDETLPRSPCLQRADEGHTVVDALGRTSYTPQPKVPRGISEPRSVGARIPMPWAGFLLGVRGRPQPTGAFFHSLYVSVGTEPGGKCGVGQLVTAPSAAAALWQVSTRPRESRAAGRGGNRDRATDADPTPLSPSQS